MATILIRASGGGVRSLASRGSAVVVMEPPENRDSRDAALELGGTRNRLLLRESLVRTRLVVEAHELGDEASEWSSVKRRTWSSSSRRRVPANRSANAFMSGASGAIRTTRAPDDARTRVKRAPSFASRSQTNTAGTASRVAFRACCAHHSSLGAYVTAAWTIVRRPRSRKKSTKTSRNRTS